MDYDKLKKILINIRTVFESTGSLFYYSGREFIRDQCPTRSAALTYFTMLSLVPLLVVVFAFFKTFGGETLITSTIKPILFEALSPGTGEQISGAIDELLKQSRPGTLGAVGFIFLILTSFSLMEQIEFTLNAIWSEKRKRPLFQRWTYYWVSLTIFPMLVGLSFSATAYLGSLHEVQEISEKVVPNGYKLLPVLIQGLAFFLLYKFLPKTKVRFIPALAGALLASVIWEFVKKGYLLFTSSAINYNVIYGSLAVLPLFMIWLFISWFVILYGAEIAFSWQNFKIIRETRKQVDRSFKMFEIMGIGLLLEAADRFINAKPALNLEEYIERQSLQPDLVKSSADKLLNTGLLKSVDGELILSCDPGTLTIDEALEAVRSGQTSDQLYDNNEMMQKLQSFIQKFDEPSKSVKQEWSIMKLLNELKKN